MTKDITIRKQSDRILEQAEALVVETEEQYADGTALLGNIRKASASVKEETEAVTRPLLEALNHERDRFRPILTAIGDAERLVKQKLLTYFNARQKKADAAAAELERKVAAGKLKPETALKRAEAIQAPSRSVIGSGSSGALSEVRKVRRVYIRDPLQVPREYFVVDEVRVRRDALAGKEIPGVEVVTENTIAGINV